MHDKDKSERLVSPKEMLEAGKKLVLDGRDPSNKNDWIILFNFFAVNISQGVEEQTCLLLNKVYHSPLTDDEIISIAQFQHAEKIKEMT